MYLDPPFEEASISPAFSLEIALVLMLAGILLLGLFPSPLIRFAQLAF